MKTSLIKSTFAVAAAFAAGSTLASSTVITTSTNDVYGATFESSTSAVAPLNDFEYQAGDSITNYFHGATEGWFAGEGDASTIEANAGVTGAALKLSTEGQTLENKFSTTAATAINDAVAGAGAVFEAQVKFVASDTITDPFDPSKAEEAANKFAIYAYAPDEGSATNLVVYHSYYDGNDRRVCVNEVFDSVDIDTGDFTKIKVEIKDGSVDSELGLYLFRVFVGDSNTAIESEYDISGEGGEWMLSANDPGADYRALSALCFKGTGYVDDIAVSALTETSTTYYEAIFNDDKNNTSVTNVADSVGSVTTPAAPTFAGFDFGGWFDDTTTNAAGASISIDADTTFAALWEAQSSGGDTPVPADDGAFSVPATEANAIATFVGGGASASDALAADTGKGTTYGQAYALGLLTFDGTGAVTGVADLPAATITFNADGEPVVTFENGMNPNTTDYVINYTLLKKTSLTGGWSGATTAAGPTTDPAALVDDDPGTAGFYKIRITISNK